MKGLGEGRGTGEGQKIDVGHLGGREGGPFLTGGATPLATCWREGGLPAFLLSLRPAPEPEAAGA